MVRGVASAVLKNVKAKGLLGNEALETMSEKMSSLQRATLLDAVRIRLVCSERDGKDKEKETLTTAFHTALNPRSSSFYTLLFIPGKSNVLHL